MYGLIKSAQESYNYLQDDLSKKIFMARLAVDIEPSMSNIIYHQPGDMLAIMDYLHESVPEDRYRLRHFIMKQCYMPQ